jgi:hypothetical protein
MFTPKVSTTFCRGGNILRESPLTSLIALKGVENVSNSTEGGTWNTRVSPEYNLTLVETNTITDQRDSVAIKTMIDGSTPIITVLYAPESSNYSLSSLGVYYTALKPTNYQPLLTLTKTSWGAKSCISNLVLFGTIALAFILL